MKVASFIILVAVIASRYYLDYANTTNLSAVSKEKRLQNEANVCTNFRLCIFLFCNKISKALFKGNIFTIFYCLSSQKYFSLPFLFFFGSHASFSVVIIILLVPTRTTTTYPINKLFLYRNFQAYLLI